MHASRTPAMTAHARGDVFHLAQQYAFDLIEVNQVHAESLFLPDALGVAVGGDVARVFAMRQAKVMLAGVTELFTQPFRPESAQVADGSDARALQLMRRLWADAPNARDRQWRQDAVNRLRVDHRQSVRFLKIGCKLGEELVRRDTD